MKILPLLFSILICVSACDENKKQDQPPREAGETVVMAESVSADTIIDAEYTFDEAVMGTKAPQSIIDQLELFDVVYHSTDGQIHKGQILSNKKIAEEIRELFLFMLNEAFVVEKAVPIVRYNWNDSLSMADNNSYSFCFRNIGYSKHASGMAIDINPLFNPLRWKKEYKPNQPEGAVSDTTVNGTLHPSHPVVEAFRKKGFRWGHTFSKYYDDHHFEKN
ncbi:MAG: M15 family metallopeptidase [Proteiniphilum sp.]|jgi:hypothetical protein|nr:M15 family metallopeptidase [Proteiniphilum sp.]